MPEYPNLENMLDGDTDHPLRLWMDSNHPNFEAACKILDNAVLQFCTLDGFEKLIDNIKKNKARFWSYITELYIAAGIYSELNNQGKGLTFNYPLATGREADFRVNKNGNETAIEISSMMNCININLLIPKLFKIAEAGGQAIEIKYKNGDIPGLDSYRVLADICEDFQARLASLGEYSYLNDTVVISKKHGISTVASYDSAPEITEGRLICDSIKKILKEAEQLRGFKGNKVVFLEMNHYFSISDYYFDHFVDGTGGYDLYKRQLFECITGEIDKAIFWWTSIDKIGPWKAFIADNASKNIKRASITDISTAL